MMNKVLMLALSSLMVLGLAACGNTNGADASSSASKKADAAAQAPAKGNGKTLVVYYSAGGHTKNVANYIAKATNGDVMELNRPRTIRKRIWTTITGTAASIANTMMPACATSLWSRIRQTTGKATIRSSSDILSGGGSLPGR